MLSRLRSTFVIAALVAAGGCSSDPSQPPPPGGPGPVKVLFACTNAQRATATANIAIVNKWLPDGSQIRVWGANDSIPPVSYLSQYDVIVYWIGMTPLFPDSLGNALGDYVDQGGKILIGQGALTDPFQLTGKIMSPGYSPFIPGTNTGQDLTEDWQIDAASLATPRHVIFQGIDLSAMRFSGGSAFSNPTLDAGATLMALAVNGFRIIALNPNRNVMGMNMLIHWEFIDDPSPLAQQFMRRMVLFLAGEI